MPSHELQDPIAAPQTANPNNRVTGRVAATDLQRLLVLDKAQLQGLLFNLHRQGRILLKLHGQQRQAIACTKCHCAELLTEDTA